MFWGNFTQIFAVKWCRCYAVIVHLWNRMPQHCCFQERKIPNRSFPCLPEVPKRRGNMKQEKEFRLIESRGEKIFNVTMNVLGVLISLEVLYPIYYTFIASISKPFFVENGTVTLLPESLEEAAFIDGASNFGIFGKIFMPLSKPARATVALFYAVGRWNSCFWAMNLLNDDSKMPLQVLLKKVIVDQQATATDAALVTSSSLSSPTTIIYATVIIAIVPMLAVFPFIQKYFKTGVTLGAVKG